MIGIAIINYYTYKKTIDCINSIISTVNIPYTIYLLDNASQNDSVKILQTTYKTNNNVKIIASLENLGYARGNNLCIDQAIKDGIDKMIIANNDIVFCSSTIETLITDLNKYDALITAPLIATPSGAKTKSTKNKQTDFKEYLMYSTYLHNFVSRENKKEYYKIPENITKVYWASGSCLCVDLKKFKSIGCFDSNTFLYFEEYIIAEKALEKNYKIIYDPTVTALHYHGASMGGNANIVTRLENFKSETYFFRKYLNASNNRLNIIRLIRCLEVLFTFSKEKKLDDALIYIKKSKEILKSTKENY